MATMRLRLYQRPLEELRQTVEGDVPRWVQRIYQSYGRTVADAPLSACVEALAEGLGSRLAHLALLLRKCESHGWTVTVDEDTLLVHTGLDIERSRRRLEDDGVWILAQQMAERGPDGEVAWR